MYLVESHLGSTIAETTTAHHKMILADEGVVVAANTAEHKGEQTTKKTKVTKCGCQGQKC